MGTRRGSLKATFLCIARWSCQQCNRSWENNEEHKQNALVHLVLVVFKEVRKIPSCYKKKSANWMHTRAQLYTSVMGTTLSAWEFISLVLCCQSIWHCEQGIYILTFHLLVPTSRNFCFSCLLSPGCFWLLFDPRAILELQYRSVTILGWALRLYLGSWWLW